MEDQEGINEDLSLAKLLLPKCRQCLKEPFQVYLKNEQLSQVLLSEANVEQNIYEALKLLNRSIACAVQKSTLSLLFFKRSSLLKLIGKLNESIDDEQRSAIMITDQNSKLNNEETSSTQEDVPSLSKKIKIEFNQQFGRHFLSTEHIKAGEVLLIERSYAAVLDKTSCWTHCSHCLDASFALIPCYTCNKVMFCSELCREEAMRKYHRIECVILSSYLQVNPDVSRSELLTIRMITTIGLENLEIMAKTQSAVFSLIYHKDSRSKEELHDLMFHALDILQAFQMLDHPRVVNLAVFIFRLFLIRESNGHSLVDEMTNKIGSGVFLTSSLVNHSCDPNLYRVNYGNTLVHYAARPILPGEQLTISYGVQFDSVAKPDRDKFLNKYNFKCTCEACIENWDIIDDLPDLPNFNDNEKELKQEFENILQELSSNSNRDVYKQVITTLFNSGKHFNKKYRELQWDFKHCYRECVSTVKINELIKNLQVT